MTPDYRNILIHLISKIKRSGDYYRKIARITRTKMRVADPDDVPGLAAKAEELERCARDMDYAYDRSTDRLDGETIEDVNELILRGPTSAPTAGS